VKRERKTRVKRGIGEKKNKGAARLVILERGGEVVFTAPASTRKKTPTQNGIHKSARLWHYCY
jgi:hypothetical protein